MQPFEGLRVVELANVLAGPAVGMFFAELGANVLKIENKTAGGDVTRSWKLPSEDKNSPISAYFASVNYQKRYHFANLLEAQDREFVYQQIAQADIVISNYSLTEAQKLGMDDATIRKHNSKIIHARITGYGDDNPRTAYDLVLQAETGFMNMNGTAESDPVKMPVALIDVLAAHQLKEAILVALLQRSKTGKGCEVSVSLRDAAISSLANQASNWLMAGHEPQRQGSLHPNIAPYGETFTCSDGKEVVLAVGNDKQFRALLRVLNLDEQEQFSQNTLRVQNRKELFTLLDRQISSRASESFVAACIANGVPAGIIMPVSAVLSDPQNQELILEENQDGILTRRVRTVAFKMR